MSAHLRPSRLSFYSKATVGSVAAASAAGSAEAAIIYFDVSPDRTINADATASVSFGSINLVNGTYTLNGLAGTYLRFFVNSGTWWQEPQIQIAGSGFNPGYYAYKLSLGDPINGTALTQWGTFGTSLGEWSTGGSGYAALRINNGGGNFNYGWAHLTYVNSGSTSALTISGFAFENTVNTSIDAGATTPIPEPGTWAAGAGLFALAVSAHLRRRREKKAAASDALLNLAGGARGVEKFRADQAA